MGGLGKWTYPDGSEVSKSGGEQQFYINRDATRVINLNRRENVNPLTPTGSYCCTVPTSEGVEMTLCANLGEWSVWVGPRRHALVLACIFRGYKCLQF